MKNLKLLIDNITKFGLKTELKVTHNEIELKQLLVAIYAEFLSLNSQNTSPSEVYELDFSYDEIRKHVEQNFPDWGWYSMILDSNNIHEEQSPAFGDAIDDLTDIIKDLLSIQWRFNNTTNSDALWHFNFLMKAHTEQHIIDLLKYLKEKD